MDSENVNQASSLIELLRDQLEILLAVIVRPVVQRQILAVLLIILIAWLAPEGIRRWRGRRSTPGEAPDTPGKAPDAPGEAHGQRGQRWLAALYHLLTPLLALVFLGLTMQLFARQGYSNGLLQGFTTVIWLWLIYRLLLTLLQARYGDAVLPYENRILTPLFIFLVILRIIDTLPGSRALADAAITTGPNAVSLGSLITALVVFYLFVVGSWVIKQMMIRALPSRLHAEPGVIESVAALIRYSLLAIGLIVMLGMLGLDFTSLAIIAGGLSVGIGIGLQDIVSNFVSGLVLLFEQSLRPGDVVELEGQISEVEKISLRATTVRTRTNEQLIIPNASFTTNQVKNLTKSERLVQIVVPLGVSYNSDPALVERLAIETGLKHPLVLAEPAPILLFKGYGDSSLDFDLLVSVEQPELTLNIRSDLYYMLWNVFAEHAIEIPFPQRDLNLGSGWERVAPASQPD